METQVTSVVHSIAYIFDRDLLRLRQEIESYQNDWLVWVTEKDAKKSGGQLCQAVIKDLGHHIVDILGEANENAFNAVECNYKSRKELLEMIEACRASVRKTFERLEDDSLQENYPLNFNGITISTFLYLMHLSAHFNYHLGQIAYHRCLI